ncbi:tyrosine-type recombinase/integrase [Butyrivibrio sp. YAB3001]|uniref:tyrosine-type recombinase/integrase n=1 Tax=Butyrivibrio sp. YAB3001 TaxID=1520812 RepID=UPI0008F638F4|nr:tyrosine-type recombinase/integrase [Butyrivibrio sp. YAB3001]SFC42005.1 Site-specific recombinase XerD [Butyrivibrio sp. YAB3001]
MEQLNSKNVITSFHQKDKPLIDTFYISLSEDEKLQLLDAILTDKIVSKDVAIYQMTLDKLKKDVVEKFAPYVRDTSKIVYYCPSKNQYKARVPKALIVEDNPAPQCAVSELQMWDKLHKYLFGDIENTTLEALYVKWLAERKADADISSKTYDRNVNTWDKYYKGNPITTIPLSKLTAKKIFDFYKSFTSGRSISRAELGNIKGIINMIYDYAVVNDIVSSNIAKTVSTKSLKCKIVNNKDKVYTPEEREKLFTYLQSLPQNVYTLGIMLMFCLDVRIGELKALRWTDYNENKGQIYIHNQIVDRKDENGKWCQLELDYTKSGEDGDRWLPVSKTARNILSQLKLLSGNSEFILTNQAGTTVKTNKFNEYLKKYCEACGVRYLSSHKIRFYAVTEQAKAGMDLLTIQHNSGHRCKSTTLHYMRNASNEAVADERWEKVFG